MADDSDSRMLLARRGSHHDLLSAIERSEPSRSFATFESLLPAELFDAELSVEGVGPISLPLAPADARSLVALSKKTCSHYHVSSVRNLWSIDPRHIELGKGFEGLLKEAVKKTQIELKLAPDIIITPHLYKLVIQKWDSSIRSPLYRIEQYHLQIATLLMFLPSRHEGGQVNLNYNDSTMECSTAADSQSEFQYIAFNVDTVVDVEAITSETRIALIYWLVAEPKTISGKDTAASINDLRQSKAPGTQELERILSTWVSQVGSEGVPSFFVYTLDEHYVLDLLHHQRFKKNDSARVQALQAASELLDLKIYYTVLARGFAATDNILGEEQPKTGQPLVEQRHLETLLPLHDENHENKH